MMITIILIWQKSAGKTSAYVYNLPQYQLRYEGRTSVQLQYELREFILLIFIIDYLKQVLQWVIIVTITKLAQNMYVLCIIASCKPVITLVMTRQA